MTNYILIDAETRAPVPLPFSTTCNCSCKIAVTVVDAADPTEKNVVGLIFINNDDGSGKGIQVSPSHCGLALITEEQFMAERD